MNNWTKMGIAGLAISQLFSCAIGMDENQEKEKNSNIQTTHFNMEAPDMGGSKLRDHVAKTGTLSMEAPDMGGSKLRDHVTKTGSK